jgi:hypothetical protein
VSRRTNMAHHLPHSSTLMPPGYLYVRGAVSGAQPCGAMTVRQRGPGRQCSASSTALGPPHVTITGALCVPGALAAAWWYELPLPRQCCSSQCAEPPMMWPSCRTLRLLLGGGTSGTSAAVTCRPPHQHCCHLRKWRHRHPHAHMHTRMRGIVEASHALITPTCTVVLCRSKRGRQ